MEQRFPPLTRSQIQLLQKGIQSFNREQFFECHEILEEAWLEASGEQKPLLQGLIQVAAALHHLRRGNQAGAFRLLTAGSAKLEPYAPTAAGIDIGALLENLEPLRATMLAGDVAPDFQAPRIHLKSLAK